MISMIFMVSIVSMISMISMFLAVFPWFPFVGAYLKSFQGHFLKLEIASIGKILDFY